MIFSLKNVLKPYHTVGINTIRPFAIGFHCKIRVLKDLKDFRLKLPIFRFISLILICATVTGCFDTAFRLDQKIQDAVAQAKAGDTATAINKLETLQSKYPQNADVAEALGVVYEVKGNAMLASNYFQKAARLAPEKKNLLLDAARELNKASMNQDAAKQLKEYLESFPEDGESWLFLGHLQFSLQQKTESIDSLTRGILLTDPKDHTAKDHLMLGSLYLQTDDFPQADYYLNKAITLANDPKVEAQALLALVQSSIRQEDWDVADVFLKRLESTDPETYASGPAKQLLQRVLAAQRSRSILYPEPKAEPEAGKVSEEPAEVTSEPKDAEAVEQPEITEPVAEEMPEEAAPASDETVSSEGQVQSETSENVEEQPEEALSEDEIQESPEEAILESTEEEPVSEPLNAYKPPENEAELLLVNSRQLIVEKQYAKAIRMTWDSINSKPESPAAWFMLSRAYAGYGQYLNAEAAALESMRLNPNNKKIVMNYLGVLQHSESPERFHHELLKIYQRFNKDPDFILALARSYARIMNDPENASVLYRRFLELEPDHQKASEVRAEIPFVE